MVTNIDYATFYQMLLLVFTLPNIEAYTETNKMAWIELFRGLHTAYRRTLAGSASIWSVSVFVSVSDSLNAPLDCRKSPEVAKG